MITTEMLKAAKQAARKAEADREAAIMAVFMDRVRREVMPALLKAPLMSYRTEEPKLADAARQLGLEWTWGETFGGAGKYVYYIKIPD